MKSLLNIGNEIHKDDVTVSRVADAIVLILKIGATVHTDQETIRHALTELSKNVPVQNVNITQSNFTGGITAAAAGSTAADAEDTDE